MITGIPAGGRYLTLADTLRANANRHADKARVYFAIGQLNHACGSLRKAVRNDRRAQALELGVPVQQLRPVEHSVPVTGRRSWGGARWSRRNEQ